MDGQLAHVVITLEEHVLNELKRSRKVLTATPGAQNDHVPDVNAGKDVEVGLPGVAPLLRPIEPVLVHGKRAARLEDKALDVPSPDHGRAQC